MTRLRKTLDSDAPANFCCWLQADMQPSEIDFCSTPESRHFAARAGLPNLTRRRHSGLMDSPPTKA